MTDVRQPGRPHRADAGGRRARAGKARPDAPAPASATRVAQVRLRADEMDALTVAMRTLHLGSTSDALREGLRLLAREAAEINAAANIRAFHAAGPVPLPDGAAAPTDAELSAADAARW